MGMGIYAIHNLVNDKMYIGSTNDFRRRKLEHFSKLESNIHINKHLQAAYNKYGKESFRFIEIEISSESQILSREQYWLDLALSEETHLYNKSLIAGKVDQTPELIQKRSAAMRGRKASQETKEKLRLAHLGQTPWNKGVKMGLTNRKGKKFSEEHRHNLSLAHIGKSPTNKGIPLSMYTKQKISKSLKAYYSAREVK